MIRDKNIEYKYQSLYLPALAFDVKISGTPVDAGNAADTYVENASTGLLGYLMDADEGGVAVMMPTPTHIDWDNSVQYRVLYSTIAGQTGAITWELHAKESNFGALPAVEHTDDAEFVSLADTASTAAVLLATPWGKADSSSTNAITGTKDIIKIYVEIESGHDKSPHFHGLEIRYLPKLTDGPQVNNQADPTDA
tara:strand:- start:35 stop:619 length:585 start_codon:yes stop_codon:yes gene_type:complete